MTISCALLPLLLASSHAHVQDWSEEAMEQSPTHWQEEGTARQLFESLGRTK